MRVMLINGPMRGTEVDLRDGEWLVRFPLRRGPRPSFADYGTAHYASDRMEDIAYHVESINAPSGRIYFAWTDEEPCQ